MPFYRPARHTRCVKIDRRTHRPLAVAANGATVLAEMTIELLSSKPAGAEGIIHQIRAGSTVLAVRVHLLSDGWWVVRIETADQAGGTADHPRDAFRLAKDLADRQTRARGLSLPWGEIEEVLCAEDAFSVDLPLDLSLPQWYALGLAISYPNLPDAATIEAGLSASHYVRRAYGVDDGPWQVVGVSWGDFGRLVGTMLLQIRFRARCLHKCSNS